MPSSVANANWQKVSILPTLLVSGPIIPSKVKTFEQHPPKIKAIAPKMSHILLGPCLSYASSKPLIEVLFQFQVRLELQSQIQPF